MKVASNYLSVQRSILYTELTEAENQLSATIFKIQQNPNMQIVLWKGNLG